MYNIIPLLLILVSLSVITVIVVKKFSVLAALDVANIPAEKEAKFKERIISNRLKRNVVKWWAKAGRRLKPAGAALGNFFRSSLSKLYQLKNDYQAGPDAKIDAAKTIDRLFAQAEEFKARDDLDAAEKKYIEIIGLDSKNLKAFKELGRIYFARKEFEEAKQTFEHLLKLKEDDEEANAQTHFNLAQVYQAMSKWPEAVKSLKKALKIEPANPKYLDTMLVISIIIKDKALALDVYGKLVKANPDNHKLEDFKRQIDEM